MLTFFADESSVHGDGAQGYGLSIYGGLVLSEETFKTLTTFLYELKNKYILPQELELKWMFGEVIESMRRIGHISREITAANKPEAYKSLKEDYDKLKGSVLDKISETDAKVIIAIRPNTLLRASSRQVVEYSIGAVARKFEKILEREKSLGIILADELPKRLGNEDIMNYQYIHNLCCQSSGAASFERLISVIPTIESNVSPIHQINDILLGAIQYYALEFMRELNGSARNFELAKRLAGKIINNFYKSSDGRYTINSGILTYPPKNKRQDTNAGRFINKLEKQLESDFNIK